MISLEEAKALIVDSVKVQECEEIDILEGRGRVLGEDIISPIDSPPFDRSPLDGYAVKAEDLSLASEGNPVTFKVIDKIYAGYVSAKTIGSFEAVRIMTGAKLPSGADTIVRQELVEVLDDNKVRISVKQKQNENVIFKGEDFKKGVLILEKGTVLNFSELTAIASLGRKKIKVYKKPVVAIITTGDELQNPGEPLSEGKIYNSNRIFLKVRLEELGCEALFFDSICDNEEEIITLVKEAEKKADILISTGGVSVGEKDIVQESVKKAGYEVLFWKVDIKPGSPMFAAINAQNKLYVGLSGTPVAAATTFELTVRGAISKMLGSKDLDLKEAEGILQDEFLKVSKKRRFLRVYLEENYENKVYIDKAYQTPGQIHTMLNSNAILEVPKLVKLEKNMKVKLYKL